MHTVDVVRGFSFEIYYMEALTKLRSSVGSLSGIVELVELIFEIVSLTWYAQTQLQRLNKADSHAFKKEQYNGLCGTMNQSSL